MAHKIYDDKTMTARMYHESDCDLSYLKNKTVAIVGFGSQGHAACPQSARQRNKGNYRT